MFYEGEEIPIYTQYDSSKDISPKINLNKAKNIEISEFPDLAQTKMEKDKIINTLSENEWLLKEVSELYPKDVYSYNQMKRFNKLYKQFESENTEFEKLKANEERNDIPNIKNLTDFNIELEKLVKKIFPVSTDF